MNEKKKADFILKHKLFWLGLAVVIVLPLISILTGMFTLELATTGKAYQTVSYKLAGSELSFEVRNIEGLKDLTTTFLEDAKNMLIEFEELDTLSWKFEGIVYSQFKIFSEDADKIGEIKFTLKLKEETLNDLGLSKSEVKLYLNGKELETKLIGGKVWPQPTAGYVLYEAVSDETGEFVIGKVVEEEVAEEAIVEEIEPAVEEEPIVEQPKPVEKNLGNKIISFFKDLFRRFI